MLSFYDVITSESSEEQYKTQHKSYPRKYFVLLKIEL